MKQIHSSKSLNLLILLIVILFFLISGCIAGKEKSISKSEPVTQQEIQARRLAAQLQEENSILKDRNQQLTNVLAKHKKLTAQLQLSILEKHAEVNRLLVKNEHLVSEFVRNKSQLRDRGNKVETVRLLAEVAATIDAAKNNNKDGAWTGTIKRAEQYLNESQVEIDNENYQGASYLASQALDLIQSTQLKITKEKEQAETEITFLGNLPMKVLNNCDVRAAPSMQSKVKFIQKSETMVTAVGYSGLWVKVKINEGEHGWIHYSFLSGGSN